MGYLGPHQLKEEKREITFEKSEQNGEKMIPMVCS